MHNHLNLLDCTIVKLEVGNLQLSREFPQDFRYYFKSGTPIHVHPVLSTNHTRALGDMKISKYFQLHLLGHLLGLMPLSMQNGSGALAINKIGREEG